MFRVVLSCTAGALYKYEGGCGWELVIHAAVTRAGHVLFYHILLKLFIFTKGIQATYEDKFSTLMARLQDIMRC